MPINEATWTRTFIWWTNLMRFYVDKKQTVRNRIYFEADSVEEAKEMLIDWSFTETEINTETLDETLGDLTPIYNDWYPTQELYNDEAWEMIHITDRLMMWKYWWEEREKKILPTYNNNIELWTYIINNYYGDVIIYSPLISSSRTMEKFKPYIVTHQQAKEYFTESETQTNESYTNMEYLNLLTQ